MGLFLSRFFWIALAAGIAIAFLWRFVRPGPLRTGLQILGTLLIFVPQLLIVFSLYSSIYLLLYQEALLSLWLVGIAAASLVRLFQVDVQRLSFWQNASQWRQTPEEIARTQEIVGRMERPRKPFVLALIVLLMGGFGMYFGRQFVLDAFASPIVVEGRVRLIAYNRRGRAPRRSNLIIDDESFYATRDLNQQLHPGERIHAEIGPGSHTVLSWRPLLDVSPDAAQH